MSTSQTPPTEAMDHTDTLRGLEDPYLDQSADVRNDECPIHPGHDHFSLFQRGDNYFWRCHNPDSGQEHVSGDIFKLYQQLYHCDFKEALERLADRYLPGHVDIDSPPSFQPAPAEKEDERQPEHPQPIDVSVDPPEALWVEQQGELEKRAGVWDGQAQQTRPLSACTSMHIQAARYPSEGSYAFCALRWDPSDERKICRPCYTRLDRERPIWKPGLPDADILRPLYQLETLHRYPDKPVMVVEGEKCMDRASEALVFSLEMPDYIVTTNLQGTNSLDQTSWRAIKDRNVVIVPDFDFPGAKMALEVATRVHSCEVAWVHPPPSGWREANKDTWQKHAGDRHSKDIADVIEKGGDISEVLSEHRETLEIEPDDESDEDESEDEPYSEYMRLAGKQDYHIARAVIERMTRDDGHHPISTRSGRIYRYDEDGGVWDPIDGEWSLEGEVRDLFGSAVYSTGPEADDWKVLRFNRSKETSVAEEIRSMMRERYGTNHFEASPTTYSFDNGTLVYRKGDSLTDEGTITFEEHDPSLKCKHKYDFEYTDGMTEETPLFDHFLQSLFKPDDTADEKIRFLQDFLGAGFFGFGYRYQKALIMHGDGSDGKSQVVELMNAVVPDGVYSNIAPQRLQEDASLRIKLNNSRLNLVEEIPERSIIQGDKLKLIIGGGEDEDRELYDAQTEKIDYRATHVMCANVLPTVSELNEGFWRRWVLMPFNRRFIENPDPDNPYQGEIIRDIGRRIAHKETKGIIQWLTRGARRVLERGGLDVPACCEKAIRRWRGNANSMMGWATERCEPCPAKEGVSTRELWEDYRQWCENNGIRERYQRTKGSFEKNLKHIDIGRRGSTHKLTSHHFEHGNLRPCKLVPRGQDSSSALH
ncbi:MAG: phage/plasmid primase, P4 family [Bradymonadaceae bacterium]